MESNCQSEQKVKAMDEQAGFLKRFVAELSEAEIPFTLVGSVAVSYHGHSQNWETELGVEGLWMRIREVVFPGQGEETAGDIH